MKTLAHNLTRFRGNMTQNELSKISGVPQSAISEAEAGKRSPRIDTIQKIAKALGVNVTDLLEEQAS